MFAETTGVWMEWADKGVTAVVLLLIVRWMLTRFEKRMDSHSAGLKGVEQKMGELLTCLRDQQTENSRNQRELIQALLGGRHDQANAAGPGGSRAGGGGV